VGTKRFRVLSEACKVVRPVFLSVVAIAVLAAVMAYEGWRPVTLALGAVVVQIAALTVFQVHRAVRELHQRSRSLTAAASQAEKHYVQVLRRIIRFAEAREKYARGHSERVAGLAEGIARKMKLPGQACAGLRTAGLLHDVGMLAVPENIIDQRTKLGVDGFRTVKRHPQAGYEILKPLTSLVDVLPAIRHHHERMNGTGYPSGLAGEDIPIEARILAVADAYDAMTHDRPHHSAMSSLEAMAELRRCTPAGYDPRCVEALAKLKNVDKVRKVLAGT